VILTRADYSAILRHDFVSFIEHAFYELNPQTPYIPGPHIEMMATKLEACRQGKIKRLIINLAPRGLKSHCTSIAFVAWWLAHTLRATLSARATARTLPTNWRVTAGW
jgi:hypothetical protein